MTISQERMAALEARRAEVRDLGGEAKARKRHEEGRLTARERIDAFFDADTFQEMGAYAHHHAKEFGMDKKRMPGDGVITGVGHVDGQPVAIFSQDFMVSGGTLGEVHAGKIVDAMTYAGHCGIPIVGINDSGGARIQEGVDALTGYSRVFRQNIMLSGVGAEVVVPAPDANHSATAAPKSGAERVSEPIAEREDAIGEKKEKKKKKAHFADSPFFFAGESRIFTWIMALAALILTVILIVGIVRARRTDADTPETASAPPALSCCLEKIPDPEGYHAR